MGFNTRLRGSIRLSAARFDRLMAIRGLEWRWDDDTIADYLRGAFSYDAVAGQLTFDAEHKMVHHRAFFDLVASVKDRPEIDVVEQQGETFDAWFPSGKFFVRPGAWAYVGEGEMLTFDDPPRERRIGPAQARLEHVQPHDWQTRPPRAAELEVDDPWLVVHWLSGAVTRTGFWTIDPLLSAWGDPPPRLGLRGGGATVILLDDGGQETGRFEAADLWFWKEEA